MMIHVSKQPQILHTYNLKKNIKKNIAKHKYYVYHFGSSNIYCHFFIFCISNNIFFLFLKVLDFIFGFWLIKGKTNGHKSKKETPGLSSLT